MIDGSTTRLLAPSHVTEFRHKERDVTELPPYPRAIGEATLMTILKTSTRSTEQWVKDMVAEFVREPRTTLEIFEFLADKISTIECARVKDGSGRTLYAVGYIDAFTQAMCDLRPYYRPPDPDDASVIDVDAVERKMRSELPEDVT